MKTMDYMESIRELTDRKSWYAVAALLDTDEARISRIRKGILHPSNEMCFKIAALLELEPSEVIAAVEMEAAKSEEKKEFWKGHFFRHGKAAMIGTAVLCMLTLHADDTSAATGGTELKKDLIRHYANLHSAIGRLISRTYSLASTGSNLWLRSFWPLATRPAQLCV